MRSAYLKKIPHKTDCLTDVLTAAVGCADVGGVSGGWVRRVGDTTTVGCNDTDETWYLACRDGRWVGNVTGCDRRATANANEHTAAGENDSAATRAIQAGRRFMTICAPGQHTAKRRRKCTRQPRSCLQLCQIFTYLKNFYS